MKPIDITGQRFSRLTAVKWTGKKSSGSNYLWEFLCDCGNSRVSTASEAKGRHVTQCKECAVAANRAMLAQNTKKVADKNRKSSGVSASHGTYSGYRGNARKRGLEFSLPLDVFLTLAIAPCIYCGRANTNVARSRHSSGDFIYTGVDRIDNTKGYIEGNCAPCCHDCNWAKKDKTQEDFRRWVCLVYAHLLRNTLVSPYWPNLK